MSDDLASAVERVTLNEALVLANMALDQPLVQTPEQAAAGIRYTIINLDALDRLLSALKDAGEALGPMAEQLLSEEMDEDQRAHADFEGGYDEMVRRARLVHEAIARVLAVLSALIAKQAPGET